MPNLEGAGNQELATIGRGETGHERLGSRCCQSLTRTLTSPGWSSEWPKTSFRGWSFLLRP